MSDLFLDDDFDRCKLVKVRRPNIHLTHTAADCIKLLSYFPWDQVFLDHDLGEPLNIEHPFTKELVANTGTTVVNWIEENLPKVSQFIIHSWNNPAADNMRVSLVRAGYQAVRVRFGKELLVRL